MNTATNNVSPLAEPSSAVGDGRMCALQYWLLLLCFMVVALDGFDTAATGFVAPALALDFAVPRATLGPLLSMALFGMTAGALIAGPLADGIGRKPVLLGSVLLFGGCTVACAGAHSILELSVLRALTGVGLGGAMPSAGTLLSEYLPPKRRAFFTNVMYCGFPLGASAGGFLAAVLVPHLGWRAVFVVGGVAPLVLLVGLLTVPESMRFMVARSWPAEKIARVLSRIPEVTHLTNVERASPEIKIRHVGGPGAILSRPLVFGTLMLWMAYFMGLLVFYLQTSWLPTMLLDARFSPQQTATIAAFLPFGGVLGTVVCGFALDRLPPFRVVAVTYLMAAASLFFASQVLSSAAVLSATIFCAGIFLVGSQSSMLALAMSYYPTVCRATGSAWMLGVGRLGGIAGALAGGYLLSVGVSVGSMIRLLTPASLVAAVAVAACGCIASRQPRGND